SVRLHARVRGRTEVVRMIGILGGMGPLATADFFAKLIQETPAQCDEDHVPVLIQSDPRIPRRPPAILDGGESPLPALLASRDRRLARTRGGGCCAGLHRDADSARYDQVAAAGAVC